MWKDYIWNPATCCFENGKYLANIMGDSAIAIDEIIEERKTFTTIEKQKKWEKTKKNFYIWHTFLLITMAWLIAVNIYCYLIKYKAKRKHLLPFYFTNNELK